MKRALQKPKRAAPEYPEWVEASRLSFEEKFLKLPRPSLKSEAYRFCPLPKQKLSNRIAPTTVKSKLLDLSKKSLSSKLLVASLRDRADQDLIQDHWEASPQIADDYFVNGVMAYWQDGFFIPVPKDSKSVDSIQFRSLFDEKDSRFVTRNLIVLEENSEAKMIEELLSIPNEQINNSLFLCFTRILLKKGSKLHYSQWQNFSTRVQHFCRYEFILEEGAQLVHQSVSLGGHRGQTRMELKCAGPNASVKSENLTWMSGNQQYDFWVRSFHDTAQTQSELCFKAIADDKAQINFNGNIEITDTGQKTEAHQLSKSLLLSPRASITTSPKLEIAADDVQVTHGASISSINDEQLYYLQTRGISKEEAAQMIIDAMAEPVIQRIPEADVQGIIRKELQLKRMGK